MLPNSTLEKYLPDKRANNYLVNQDFVLRLVKKLEPEYFYKLTGGSFDARQANVEKEGKRKMIKVTKEVWELLMKEPFKSSKCNRVL